MPSYHSAADAPNLEIRQPSSARNQRHILGRGSRPSPKPHNVSCGKATNAEHIGPRSDGHSPRERLDTKPPRRKIFGKNCRKRRSAPLARIHNVRLCKCRSPGDLHIDTPNQANCGHHHPRLRPSLRLWMEPTPPGAIWSSVAHLLLHLAGPSRGTSPRRQQDKETLISTTSDPRHKTRPSSEDQPSTSTATAPRENVSERPKPIYYSDLRIQDRKRRKISRRYNHWSSVCVRRE